jgi:hydroxyacylglutathione hydrolase
MLPIRAFKDNYIWFFFNEVTRAAWVVDPGAAAPVIKQLTELRCSLAGILLTHHHADHSGGIAELVSQFNHVRVVASHLSRVAQVTHRVKENDFVDCLSHHFKVLEIPGHTLDHVAFFNEEFVFTGDTLFSAGCGRVFEGTYPQMFASLAKLKALPDAIRLYCGHEYTLANLKFAVVVLPENIFIQNKLVAIEKLIAQGSPSLPSTLGDEKKMNPFLQCETTEVIRAAELHSGNKLKNAVEVFSCLREWKNSF